MILKTRNTIAKRFPLLHFGSLSNTAYLGKHAHTSLWNNLGAKEVPFILAIGNQMNTDNQNFL